MDLCVDDLHHRSSFSPNRWLIFEQLMEPRETQHRFIWFLPKKNLVPSYRFSEPNLIFANNLSNKKWVFNGLLCRIIEDQPVKRV